MITLRFPHLLQTSVDFLRKSASAWCSRMALKTRSGAHPAAGIAAAVLVIAGWPEEAHAYPDLGFGNYEIINRNSGKVLDCWNAGTANETNVVQWPANGQLNQHWEVENIGGNQYRIRSLLSSRYLDVYGYSTANNGNIQIYDWAGTDNQKWIIQPTSEGYYTIKGVQSGKLVEVTGISTADGANVVQYDANGGPHQEWSIEPLTVSAPTGLAANTGNRLVALTWNSSTSGSTRFNIKRSTTSGSGYETIAVKHNYTTYYDSFVNPGTTYYYKVSAVNRAGESADSAEVSAIPLTLAQQWRKDHFGTIENLGDAAEGADPDDDGTRNKDERAYAMDPNVPDSELESTVDPNGQHLWLHYRKSRIASDLDLTMEENGDLVSTWNPAIGANEILSDDGTVQTLRFSSPLGSVKKKFFRLIPEPKDRPRVIVTTDGEADDQASMVRFLLTCNEVEVEGIVNSSSEFHWVGGLGWNAFHPVSWVKDYIELYAQVYDNLLLHDPGYPTPEYLLSRWKVGNISAVSEDNTRTDGAWLIVRVLLDSTDPRPVWIQAWGGCNTISAALKIIQQDYPDRMAEAASKLRLYLIWEQDWSYYNYIRHDWEPYNIPTIISDQFDCIAYEWPNDLPASLKASHFNWPWAASNIVNGHGPLCAAYTNNGGAFNAEGDSPAFLHTIPNGLRNMESPGWGGWGGRYVKVRNNVWMDPPPAAGWTHPTGRWFIDNSWAKELLKSQYTQAFRENYFKPIWRWMDDAQNDFAARADWCVMDYVSANHHPVVRLKTPLDIDAVPGQQMTLDATPTSDPDGHGLYFHWWNYFEADSYPGAELPESYSPTVTITVPGDAAPGQEIHMICEVVDSGSPPLTRYQRVVIHVTNGDS